jgi:hypothetical protein
MFQVLKTHLSGLGDKKILFLAVVMVGIAFYAYNREKTFGLYKTLL